MESVALEVRLGAVLAGGGLDHGGVPGAAAQERLDPARVGVLGLLGG
jgi:hypothetical protein